MGKLTILIVDDHPVFRDGLRSLLRTQHDLQVVGETESVAGALAEVRAHKPDVVLLDLTLKDGTGFEALPRICEEAPKTQVIVVTGQGMEQMRKAMDLGARGFVTKDTASADLLEAIRAVLSGKLWRGHEATQKLLGQRPASVAEESLESLTPREQEILRLVGQGKRDAEIARELSISQHTVKTHVSSVMGKLGIDDRLKLTLYA